MGPKVFFLNMRLSEFFLLCYKLSENKGTKKNLSVYLLYKGWNTKGKIVYYKIDKKKFNWS